MVEDGQETRALLSGDIEESKDERTQQSSDQEEFHPPAIVTVAMITTLAINSIDWAVLIPVEEDVADFVGKGRFYGTMLVACLYLAYPFGLKLFYIPEGDELYHGKTYRKKFVQWCGFSALGNFGFTAALYFDPPSVAWWLMLFRIFQGIAQAIAVTVGIILTLSTSTNTRNVYSGYTWGFALNVGTGIGVLLCALLIEMLGRQKSVNGVPVYLLAPTGTMCLILPIACAAIFFSFPEKLERCPDHLRRSQAAPLIVGEDDKGGAVDEELALFRRKRCIIVCLIVGFCRATMRTAWLHTASIVMESAFNISVLHSSMWFFVIVLLSSTMQQVFARMYALMDETTWIRFTEWTGLLTAMAMCLAYFDDHLWGFGFGQRFAFFAWSTGVWYTVMQTNSNLINVRLSKFVIDGDTLWGASGVTLMQVVSQTMFGRILGPIVGDWAFYAHGLGGFYAMLFTGTFLLTAISLLLV